MTEQGEHDRAHDNWLDKPAGPLLIFFVIFVFALAIGGLWHLAAPGLSAAEWIDFAIRVASVLFIILSFGWAVRTFLPIEDHLSEAEITDQRTWARLGLVAAICIAFGVWAERTAAVMAVEKFGVAKNVCSYCPLEPINDIREIE